MFRQILLLISVFIMAILALSCTSEDAVAAPGGNGTVENVDDESNDDDDADDDDDDDDDDSNDDDDDDDDSNHSNDDDTDEQPLDVMAALERQTMFSIDSTGAAAWLYPGMYVDDVRLSRATVASMMDESGDDAFPVITVYQGLHCADLDVDTYLDWIEALAVLMSEKPGVLAVVIEPDSFAMGYKEDDVHKILDEVCGIIGENADNAGVFLDVGHSGWVDAEAVWKKVSEYEYLDHIDGFALNTSNFQSTENETTLAQALFALSGRPSIIDTSRNGCGVPSAIHNPDDNEWCVGDEFAHHPSDPAVLFNYYNKPWDEAD